MNDDDDVDIVFDNADLSPLERLFIKVENAKSSEDIQGAAEIASGILCGIKDAKGNLKYYNQDPTCAEGKKDKYKTRENLFEMFQAVGEAHGQSKVKIHFKTEGVHGSVGEEFTIDVPEANADKAIEAVEKEGNKQDLAYAHVAMTPIMGLLGAEGLIDPRRKVSLAGKAAEMKQSIDESMTLYDILKRDKDEELTAELKRKTDHIKELEEKVDEFSGK